MSIKSILQVDPFPPTDIEAIAITNIGLMFAHIFILMFFIILMIYCMNKFKDYLTVLTVYSFALIIGMESLTHIHTPFSPMLEIFFLVFQTVLFLIASLKFYSINNKK